MGQAETGKRRIEVYRITYPQARVLCALKRVEKSLLNGERGALQYPFIELMKLVRGVRFLCRPFFQCRGKNVEELGCR